MSRPTVVVAVHDGWYGYGTGAGRSNRSLIEVLARNLAPGVRLVVMPIRLQPGSPEYQADWHQSAQAAVARVAGQVEPIDNGTGGMRRFGGLSNFQKACESAATAIMRLQPSSEPLLVLACDAPFYGLGPLLPAELRGHLVAVARSTAVLHDPDDAERAWWEEHGLRDLISGGGRVAVISQHMYRHLVEDLRLPGHALVPLRNGLIDEDWRIPPPDSRFLPREARRGFLLGLGRAAAYKGWDDLLDALALKPPPWHTVLAAVAEVDNDQLTPYQLHLRERITAERLPVTLLPRFDPGLRGLLAHPALVATVVPSREEPFGRVPLEAFAAGGAPVVATTAGGLAELVFDGRTGYGARPGNARSLAEAIGRALAAGVEERRQIRQQARELAASTFNYEINVRMFMFKVAPWALPPVERARRPRGSRVD
ncbi:glycosyltransferase family 4 protein [Nonomuraea sp. NPDC050790]|uniref:glycosyltransferase family 4 protein n=1 Tax=Nonomuraea sp. NPDC050790 TaxID=3364371 RepID=UPI00379C3465